MYIHEKIILYIYIYIAFIFYYIKLLKKPVTHYIVFINKMKIISKIIKKFIERKTVIRKATSEITYTKLHNERSNTSISTFRTNPSLIRITAL